MGADKRQHRLCLAALATGMLAAACPAALPSVEQIQFRCRTDADCGSGRTCADGQCVPVTPLLPDAGVDASLDAGLCGSLVCPANTSCTALADGGFSCRCGDRVCAAGETCLPPENGAIGTEDVVLCCPGTQRNCRGQCTDITANLDHCGSCAHACAWGEQCIANACWCGSSVGCDGATQDCCGGACRSVTTDSDHCGLVGTGFGCSNACHNDVECREGRCACTGPGQCGDNYVCCGASYCADLNNDPFNCHACGARCGVAELCVGGSCVCDGSCEDNDPCTEDSCVANRCQHTTLDADDDGYCDQRCPDSANGPAIECFDGDCDDRAAAVHPGAVEVCDGMDNDCNAATGDGANECPGHCCGLTAGCRECCTLDQCGSGDWQCQANVCRCDGTVCNGSCHGPGRCCQASDCGSGNWSCVGEACQCAATACGDRHCPVSGECCAATDCGAGSWTCTVGHRCQCAGEVCTDNHCRAAGECCDAADCGTGSWSCSGHACSCAGSACSDRFCTTGSECCSDAECGGGSMHCSLHQCVACAGVLCNGTCYPTGTCCQDSDCGAGSWDCDASHRCQCRTELCDGYYCRSWTECCGNDDCGAGDWTCDGTYSCQCWSNVCSDSYCAAWDECCSDWHCPSGHWSCEPDHRCSCSGTGLERCADDYCRTMGECCVAADCGTGPWTCGFWNHRCSCSGGGKVDCGDGFCRLAGQCCQPSDCGSGSWSCTNHTCSCVSPNINCNGSCRAPNACGGCANLLQTPGDSCGTNDCGIVQCVGTENVTCAGDHLRNDCNGCATLPFAPGSACGNCGQYVCSGVDDVICSGDHALNACSGCTTLTNPPGTSCPSCGTYECQGPDSTICQPGTPIDGVWGTMSDWSACSAACDGTQARTRSCDNPPPSCGGLACTGCRGTACPDVDTETRSCNPATDCGTGAWTCSLANSCECATPNVDCSGNCRAANACGGCTTLANLPGGTCCTTAHYECSGAETTRCDCGSPVAGGWSSCVGTGTWSNDGSCGQYQTGLQKQTRTGTRSCTSPAPSCCGADCTGSTSCTEEQFIPCTVDAGAVRDSAG